MKVVHLCQIVIRYFSWITLLFLSFVPQLSASEKSYSLFESGQVRPLALSPQRDKLYAVNTPDNTLEIFNVTDQGLQHHLSIPVGMEPVAVAIANPSEAWVVNHLSDSVSIVSLESGKERVIKTLLVGDEPRDIVFAGKDANRAFITTAHRGQNAPYDPQFSTPGIGRADVWVFDRENLGDGLQAEPLTIISLFTDTPRALAVSADKKHVYAAGFKTGTQTTTVWHSIVTANGGAPEPTTNYLNEEQPASGLIVKFDGQHWLDESGRQWDDAVKFSLPDKDVFVINAMSNPPAIKSESGASISHVGSVLFNMIVNPVNNKVYVTNLDSSNQKRFEGHGNFAGQTLRGAFVKNRISVINGSEIKHRHLNKHIDYTQCCAAIPNDENKLSLSTPMGMAISEDGKTLYVAAFGSAKVAVYDTKKLEDDSFYPSLHNQINISGGGASGLVLDEARKRLYVLTRFDNSISVIDTTSKKEIRHLAMYNPEPDSVTQGRPLLYNAAHTSSRGDSSCASCHIFGDMDQLAWDLGDPDEDSFPMLGKFRNTAEILGVNIKHEFSPMKGPMTTQSLRGMANHGPMHWRGDRTNAGVDNNTQPDSGQFDEQSAFKKFNPAFVGLIGRNEALSNEDMNAFTQFILQLMYPPNPVRNLDNSLTAGQQEAFERFMGPKTDTNFGCAECHQLDRQANAEYGVAKPGFFGTDGFYSLTRLSKQGLKVPHLRNIYQKIGMFGFPNIPQLIPDVPGQENQHMGDQIKGFGLQHDGSRGTVFLQQSGRGFIFREPGQNGPKDPGNAGGYDPDRSVGDIQRKNMESLMLAFDSNLFPVVGQQVTVNAANYDSVAARIDLLMQQAELQRCDLVVRQSINRGYLYRGAGKYQSSLVADSSITDSQLRALAKKLDGELTFTCVPPGSGQRIALDRDEDGVYNLDEVAAGTKPNDATSFPGQL
ncbi:MAG: hypothetical protein OEY11_06735 [Gammaproteobacteria bacterium]|nr:hypothetical protein [Gammaproteobacteria bacterium]